MESVWRASTSATTTVHAICGFKSVSRVIGLEINRYVGWAAKFNLSIQLKMDSHEIINVNRLLKGSFGKLRLFVNMHNTFNYPYSRCDIRHTFQGAGSANSCEAPRSSGDFDSEV